jgi:hypothetical protein
MSGKEIMNPNNDLDRQKLELICASSRHLLDLPKPLPPLPEVLLIFERAIRRRQTEFCGGPHSGDYLENQQNIQTLQNHLQLLRALQSPASRATVDNQQPTAAPQPRQPQANPAPPPSQSHAAPTPQPSPTQATPEPPPGGTSSTSPDNKNPAHESVLDHLTGEQEELVDVTLRSNSNRAAAKILSRPPPTGLGFPVSRHVIDRYKSRLAREQIQADLKESCAAAEALLKTGDDTQLAAAAQRLTRASILRHFMSPTANIQTLIDYHLKTERLRLLELREQRLHSQSNAKSK